LVLSDRLSLARHGSDATVIEVYRPPISSHMKQDMKRYVERAA